MKILCAVRGGPQSQLTVTRAVELAREHDAELVFLYVVDAEFLGYATVGRPSVILKELRATGAFTMEMLRERVAHDGIDTDYVVHTGDVGRQIIESVRWQDADTLVMGRPVKSPRDEYLHREELQELCRAGSRCHGCRQGRDR